MRPEITLVLYDDTGVVASLDEHDIVEREFAFWPLEYGPQLQQWLTVLKSQETELAHLELLKFLRQREGTLVDPTLLGSLSELRSTGSTEILSHHEDGANYGIMFRRANRELSASIPRRIVIDVEAWSGEQERVTIPIELYLAKFEQSAIMFELSCPTWPDIARKLIDEHIARFMQALGGPEWIVLAGTFPKEEAPMGF